MLGAFWSEFNPFLPSMVAKPDDAYLSAAGCLEDATLGFAIDCE